MTAIRPFPWLWATFLAWLTILALGGSARAEGADAWKVYPQELPDRADALRFNMDACVEACRRHADPATKEDWEAGKGELAVALRDALARVSGFDWVVVTSPNGARRLCAGIRDGRDLAGVQLAAVGPGTAAVLAEHGLVADLVPPKAITESLLEAFPPAPAGGGRVLLVRAAVARDVLPEGLRQAGWEVEDVDAYRNVPAELDDRVRERIAGAEVVTFASASAVKNFVAAAGVDAVPPVVAAIGPITAAAATELGLEVAVEAEEHTLDGLVRALLDHLGTQ